MKKLFGRKGDRYKFVTPKPTKDTCPYCGFNFEKVPTRKKKCPECDNYVFVRGGELYTEEEKNIKDWLKRVDDLGIRDITREMFNKTREKLSIQIGAVATVNDTALRILDNIHESGGHYRSNFMVSVAISEILRSEGKSTIEVMQEAFRLQIIDFKRSGTIKYVRWCTANDDFVCDVCRPRNGKKFLLSEIENLIPAHEGCRCWIGPIVDELLSQRRTEQVLDSIDWSKYID